MTATAENLPPLPVARRASCPLEPPADYERLRTACPVSQVRSPTGMQTWLVTRYEDIRAVLGDLSMSSRGAASSHINGASHDVESIGSGNILRLDGDAHKRLRRKVIGELTVRRVESMRPRIRQVVNDHLDRMLATQGPVDLVAEFAMPIPSLVICDLLGVPYSDRDLFLRLSSVMVDSASTRDDTTRASKEMSDYLAALFERKQSHPEDDLFSRLIADGKQSGDPLSLPELVMLGLSLLVAGHETTTDMIALSSLLLIEHPEQQRALADAPAPAVEELLRYLSVVQFGLLRHATRDTTVGGTRVSAGDWLVAALNSGNRDETVFPHADDLDLSRQDSRTHLAFGFGPHQCIGQQLSRVELQEALPALFARIPALRLAVPSAELTYKNTTLVYGLKALPVRWDQA